MNDRYYAVTIHGSRGFGENPNITWREPWAKASIK